jgi:hypothetical protein
MATCMPPVTITTTETAPRARGWPTLWDSQLYWFRES